MDMSLVTAAIGAQTGLTQLAVAGSMLKMNTQNAASVIKLIDAAQQSMNCSPTWLPASERTWTSAFSRIAATRRATLTLYERTTPAMCGALIRSLNADGAILPALWRAFASAQVGQFQLAVAARLARTSTDGMNDTAFSIAQLVDAA
jgi:hypothetical protein